MKQFERLIAMLVLCASAFFLLIDESQAIEYDEFSNCSLDGWNETTAKWGGIVDSNWSDYLLVGTYVDQTFGRLYLNCYWRFPLTIPRDSTILSANIRFTPEVPVQGDGALVASFQALVPDGIWETSVAGLGSYFYPSATALRSIPLQGTPVEWWISGLQQYTLYDGPDIANLVQERIEDADYDPNGSTAKIGLALNYVSEDAYASIKPSTYNNCTTWWYPRLCVVWTPGNVNLDKAQPKEIDAFTNNARFTKEPVDVITGKMVTFPQVDFTLSGLNEPLEFIRNYSSQSEYDGVLGYGWTHNYNIILTSYDYDTTLVTIMDGEGKHHFFTDTDGDRTYAPTINDGTSVVKTFGSPDTYVWKTKDGKTYHFDEIHKTICTNPPSCSDNDYLHYLTAIEYKDGNQISFSYTINSGNITHSEIVDTHGRIVSLNYSNGRIVSIDEPGRHDAGQLIQFGYTNGNLTSVSQPVDANTTYTRYYYYNDPNDPHNMTRLQDQRGNSFYYAYDANDRCYLSYGDNVGGWPSFKTQLQYFPDDNQTVVTRFRDAEQFTDTYTYSGEYITQVDHALSGITEKYSYGLNPGGTSALTKLIVGPPDEWHTNGYYLKTISHYNANFDLIDTVEGTVGSESADPTSTPVRMYYDDANNPNLVTRIVDQRNVTTKFTYSTTGKVTQTEKYTEGQTHHEITALGYNADGTLSSVTDPIYRVTSFTYYANKTLQSVNPPDVMPPIEYQYDAAGRLTQIKQKNDSGGDRYTDIARDWLGRTIQITHPAAEQGETRLVVPYDYDATDLYDTNASYGVNVIDTNGIKTQYLYNSAGLLWKMVKDKGVGKMNAVTIFAYDAFGNFVTLTDAKNQATTFTYDSLDRLATIHNAQNGQKSFVYYPDNSLKIRYDEKGQYIQYRYDVNNRLDLALYQDGSWVQYGYEPNGLLSTAWRSVATLPVSFTYDSINRLLETNGELAGDVDKITYGYWESGHRSLMNSTLLGQSNYWLTLWNAPWKIQNPQGLVTEYQYDPDNCNLWKIIKTANIYTTFDFDNLDRLKSYTTYTSTTNAYTYEYDPDGSGPQPDKNTIQRITYPAAEGKKYEYNYDTLYRLSNEYWKTTGGSSLYTRNYLYDYADNRTQVSGGTTTDTYTINNLNQVTAIDTGNASFQYDLNGNMTSKTVNGLTATLQYDYENRLVRINYPAQSGGGWTEFVYDALGRRLKTIEKNAQGAVTSEWHYAYDGLDMIGCSTEATLWWQASRMARALTIR